MLKICQRTLNMRLLPASYLLGIHDLIIFTLNKADKLNSSMCDMQKKLLTHTKQNIITTTSLKIVFSVI